jgi:hypothetical protein
MVLSYFQNLFGGWNKRICLGIKKDMSDGYKRCGNYTSNNKNHCFCWIHQFQSFGESHEWWEERYENFNLNWSEFENFYFNSRVNEEEEKEVKNLEKTVLEEEVDEEDEVDWKEFPLYDDEEQAVEDWKQEYLLWREKMHCKGEGDIYDKIEFKGSLNDWRKEFEAYKLKKK